MEKSPILPAGFPRFHWVYVSIVFLLHFVLLPGLPAQQTAEAPPRDPVAGSAANGTTLWKLSDEDNTVYLLGSVHLLRPQDHPLPEAMLLAYDEAEKLALEISPQEMMGKGAMLMLREGTYQDGGSLKQDLEPATYEKLQEKLKGLGFPPIALNNMKPWFAAVSYVTLAMMKQGYSADSGVDMFFASKAAQDGKPVESLETPEFQISLFKSLSEGMEDEFVLKTLEETDMLMTGFDEMIAAWKNGESGKIEELLNTSFDQYPELRETFLVERNADWIPKILNHLQGDEDVLVIVGAGHLVGEGSVIDMLRDRDHTVTQL